MRITLLLAIPPLLHLAHSLPHNLNSTCLRTTYLNSTLTPHLQTREHPSSTFPFTTSICRGIRLHYATALPLSLASQFLDPITSPFTGTLRDELHHWGYTEVPIRGHLCDFDTTHHLETAFSALGIDPRSEARGGGNVCWFIQHSYVDHVLPVGAQSYWVDDVRYRMTGAHFSIGINPSAGIVYFLNRRSAQQAAGFYWGRAAASEELPALRSSSDIAWGLWNRVKWGRLREIRAFMSLMVVNEETLGIVEWVLERRSGTLEEGRKAGELVRPWPGTTFGMDEIEGQALLGSPNGLAAGFFLAQHKEQLGGDKVIDKVTVFRSERYGSLPNLLFWVA